jgi:hypothetical protein
MNGYPCRPAFTLLRLVDGNGAVMGKVWNACLAVQLAIQAGVDHLTSGQKRQVEVAWGRRWTMLHVDLHAAAFTLDPEFHGHESRRTDLELKAGFHAVLGRMLSEEAQIRALKQHTEYSSKDGVWGHDVTWKLAKVVPAHAWWMEYSAAAPDLAEVAIRVLSQVSSACCCERNWSTYDFIHSKLRNRLTPARAESLVYVFSNLRLLKKSTDVSYEEEFPEWAEDVPAPTVDWDSDDEFDEFVE